MSEQDALCELELVQPFSEHVERQPLVSGRGHQPSAPHTADDVAAPSSVRWCLYTSYGCAAWAWRSWEFAVALLLIRLYPNSLLLVSVYGLLDNLVCVALGSTVGWWIDRTERVAGARSMYLLQNACIALSAGSAAALVWAEHLLSAGSTLYWALTLLMMCAGALSSAGSTGVQIAVEKGMVQALCSGDAEAASQMNAGMRAIDLTALLAAPLLSGVLMTYCGTPMAVLVLAGYALGAWVPELLLLSAAVRRAPALRAPKPPALASSAAVSGDSSGRTRAPLLQRTLGHLSVYSRQEVLLPNLALALLYSTVLSLGFLMTSYLKWTGLTEAEVSAYRGLGALFGLLATVLYPYLHSKLGVTTSSVVGLCLQLGCLCLGVLPVAWIQLHGAAAAASATAAAASASATSGAAAGPAAAAAAAVDAALAAVGRPSVGVVRLMVAGTVTSRTGLWLFDLAVTQLVQTHVQPAELGVVCGMQSSLQAACGMLPYVGGLLCPDPARFVWLMLGSLCCVAAAAALQCVYALTSQRLSQAPGMGSSSRVGYHSLAGAEEGSAAGALTARSMGGGSGDGVQSRAGSEDVTAGAAHVLDRDVLQAG